MPLPTIDSIHNSVEFKIIADGSKLWAYGHDRQSLNSVVALSTDRGNTWAVQDAANQLAAAAGTDAEGGIRSWHDAASRKIWFAMWPIQNPFLGVGLPVTFRTFSLNSATYSAAFGNGATSPLNPVGGAGSPETALEQIVVLSNGVALIFYWQFSDVSSGYLNFAKYDSITDSWSLAGTQVSQNQPAAPNADGSCSAHILGAAVSGTTAYLFYKIWQGHENSTNVPTEGIYFCSIDSTGAQSPISTVMADGGAASGAIRTERTNAPYAGVFPGSDPTLAVQNSKLQKTWLGFRNIYVRNGRIFTAVSYRGPGVSGLSPALLIGSSLVGPVWSYSIAQANPANFWEAVAAPSGEADYVLYATDTETQPVAGVYTNPLASVFSLSGFRGTWSPAILQYTASPAHDLISYPWPVLDPITGLLGGAFFSVVFAGATEYLVAGRIGNSFS